MKRFTRNKSASLSSFIIKRLLQNKYIQKKHLIAYLLEYIGDYGIMDFLRVSFRTIWANGIQSAFHPRKTLLYKINNRGSVNLLANPPKVAALDLEVLSKSVQEFSYRPKISFILPVYNTDPNLLKKAIESVKKQVYENWELCIADDCSTNIGVRNLLANYAGDKKIHITFLASNSGISEASNSGIYISTGDYVALLDHDDEVTPDALFWVVKQLNENGQTDIFYSDECKIDERGNLSDYFFKPDWSPELLFNMMYTGHLTVYRKDFLVKEVGVFRKAYDFSQDYDLMLRASEKTTRITHLRKVLYHWRMTKGSAAQGDKPYARKSNLAALEDAMRRRSIPANVTALPTANWVKPVIDHTPTVSIIIPTDSFNNLKDALESIYSGTLYTSYEIVVVTNSGLIQEMKNYFNEANLVFVPYDRPYNFSDKCNRGAEGARHDVLIFFNDDVRPLQNDWIQNTIEYLFIPGIGGVSPKLVYENDTIQYAGMATGVRNLIGSTLHGFHKDSNAYNNYAQLVRNVSILSGACLAIKKSLFIEIGGFDAVNTPSAHSDVDLSFKIMEKGLRNLYTPYASLRHIGHLSLKEHEKKQPEKKDKADIFMLKKWMKYLPDDPYFPEPMRNFLYHDSPQPFKLYGTREGKECRYKGDVLLVTHDLSLSGAPLNLYDLANILKANGYFVVVCAPSDGPLRALYLKDSIPVITDALLLSQEDSVSRFARNFDIIICNTIVTWPVVKQMQDFVTTLWWVQEASAIDSFAQNSGFAQTLRKADTVIGLSDYALSYIRKYNANAIKIYNSCPDIYRPEPSVAKSPGEDRKIIVSLIGSVEKRKGQDILLEALDYMDNELLEKVEIRFVGRFQDPHFTKKLKRITRNKPFVRFVGEVTRETSHQLIKETDVLVNASRDEALSVALVEGCCLAKPCIVSEQTGIAELITDGINGFIFRHQDAADLAKTLSVALQNTGQLAVMGLAARKTYETFLSMDAFEKNMLHLMKNKKIPIDYTATTT